jgi:hypothetical protein
MATTYRLISSVTVGSGGATDITFSSIPATYTDLVIKGSFRGAGAGSPSIMLDINGVSTNRTMKWLQANGSGSVASYSFTTADIGTADTTTQTGNTFSSFETYLPNYAGANYKSFSGDSVQENNAAVAYADLMAGLWSSTSAITSLKVYINGQNLVEYSTAYLYGISNA